MKCVIFFLSDFLIFTMTKNCLQGNKEGNGKSQVHSLVHTVCVSLILFPFSRDCPTCWSFSPWMKKQSQQPCSTHHPWRTSDTTETTFITLWKTLPPPLHSQAETAEYLAYFFWCPAVPSGRRSRECSEDRGSTGSDGCRAGPQEGTLTAPGALYTPLPMPPAALPNGNAGMSKLPLPSILKSWKEANRDLLNHASTSVPPKVHILFLGESARGMKALGFSPRPIRQLDSVTNCY